MNDMDQTSEPDHQSLPQADEPSMMDNMEDLFGEAADDLGLGAAPLSLPQAPLSTPVLLRLADLQRSGCCTKLAWSNTGSIACISDDGLKITFHSTLRNPRKEQYELSKPSKHPLEAPDGRHFVHIQFSGFGPDLAAVDSYAGIHIYSMAGAIGRMQPVTVDPAVVDGGSSVLDTLVGMYWLPLSPAEVKVPYFTQANKNDGTWTTNMRGGLNEGVSHHVEGKGALFYVTASHKLCLLYQNHVNAWQSVSIELEALDTTQTLLSHAAIGPEGHQLVLATHDRAHCLRTYSISINWNPTEQHAGNMRFISVAPALHIGHLAAVEGIAPQQTDTSRISHLAVVPSPPQHVQDPSNTTICAVFTQAPVPLDPSQGFDTLSVLARWTIDSITPALHESFTKLKQNGSIPVQPATSVLRRQLDVPANKLVLGLSCLYLNTILALIASDGTIEFRSRTSENWNILHQLPNHSTVVKSLPQSSLGYFPTDHVPHAAHSTDGSALVYSKPGNPLELRFMTLLSGWQPLEKGMDGDASTVEAAVICLSRQYAILATSHASSDEALAVLPTNLSMELRTLFVRHLIFTFCRQILDVSMLEQKRQQHHVLSDPWLARAMSAQLVLGVKPGTLKRTFAGQFAYCLLNLKLIGLSAASSMSRDMPAGRPDIMPFLVGHMRWSLDFLQYIIESLTQIKRLVGSGLPLKHACEEFTNKTGNPVVQLLLCSYGRTYLRVQMFFLVSAIKLLQSSIPRARTLEDRTVMVDVYDFAKSVPVGLSPLMEFMQSLDTIVRSTYTDAGVDSQRRYENEIGLITEGRIPDDLTPVVENIFNKMLPDMTGGVDMGKLYFWDTTWLGIDRIATQQDTRRFDAIRKTPLRSGMKLRICRRCGAVMEDIPSEAAKQAPAWLYHAQRQCYCQTYWWIE
ncbi:hypothetical protein KC340_g5325 [Hortaea werneckii]|nr:hypothetical protein KC342_g5635 [Hortaea werneckii]KAI7100350.1 hypothetical protein KC339_g7562 [Hortaea werneckii]KAI7242455.1 hypothetical protein KC365_g3160 [Hortaea werneckii]KAI7328013.1 hypothetical protein KC340_g5325 [Hortaea werneckii]KAI7386451.1 hypothetical protein KC328_g9882 [Hortaea werneckii]